MPPENTDSKRKYELKSAIWVALICALAFVLRYLYIVSLDHLLCQFGDAYFFLAGGSKLREFICQTIQAGNFNLVGALPPASANGMVAMGSISVSDRLMVDGPIFPAYLALVQWLVGLAPGSLLFDTRAIQISLVNALLDAFTCRFIYLSANRVFGQKAGSIAAILFAIYPASIINTQSCYTEPFGCFILSVWAWLVFSMFARPATAGTAAAAATTSNIADTPEPQKFGPGRFFVLGIVTGLLTLTRPPFVFLPFIFTALLAGLRLLPQIGKFSFSPKKLLPLAPLLAGLLTIFLPWMAVTNKATGHCSLFVNRLPAFNLYLGNQLNRDGWRAYPFPENIPETTAAATAQILEQAKAQPLPFISMELRKIPRLWMGIWNEFQYQLFGIPVEMQEIFHQTLLSLAGLSLLLLVSKRESLRDHDAAISLAIAVLLVQNLYLAFEPISRYSMTAIPLVVLLVGYLLSVLSTRAKLYQALIPATVIVIVLALHAQRSSIATFAALTGGASPMVLAVCQYIAIFVSGYFLLQLCFKRIGLDSKAFNLLAGGAFALIGLLTAVQILGNPEMTEWKTTLTSPAQKIRQTISLPATGESGSEGNVYLLIDLSQGQCPVPLKIAVNGKTFAAYATPWWQVRPNLGFLDALELNERAMATSLYNFRQWYIVPLPKSLVNYDASNTVELSLAEPGSLTVYGDYTQADQIPAKLPSLHLASWTKAFCTYDHQDSRVYESLGTAQVRSEFLSPRATASEIWDRDDLSTDTGKQCGQYRLHFLVFPRDNHSAQADNTKVEPPQAVMTLPAERTILGGNPPAMNLGGSPLKISPMPVVPGQPFGTDYDFELNCQLSSIDKPGWALIGVLLEGNDDKDVPKKWISRWQPYAIKTEKKWTPFYISDSIPESVARLHNLRVSLTTCPFFPDYLLLHQMKAVKNKIGIKDLTLTVGTRRAEPEIKAGKEIRIY